MPSPTPSQGVSLAELASRTGTRVDGDAAVRVERVATLEGATPGSIAFLVQPRYRARLAVTRASAVIVAPVLASQTPLPKLVSDDPYATYAKVAQILHPAPQVQRGIHPTAVVDAHARVDASARIDAYACI